MILPAPRLRMAAEAAVRCLLEEDVRAFPVSPEAIIARRGWQLRTFRHAALRYSDGTTNEDMAALMGTRDALTSVRMEHGRPVRYLILYNDQVDVPERIAFSLAHEIGHILLGHFAIGGATSAAPDQQRAWEQEANTFAANLLAPAPILSLLRPPVRDDMRRLFGMSRAGWQTRLASLPRDRQLLAASSDALRRQFAGYMYRRRCASCGAVFTDKTVCPGCGSSDLRWHPGGSEPFPWTQDVWQTRTLPDPLMLENPLADDSRWHGDDRGIY